MRPDRRLPALFLAGALLAAGLPPPVFPQAALRPGARVRVHAEGPGVEIRGQEGTYRGVEGAALLLEVETLPRPLVVPLAAVTRLEVSVGRESRAGSALKGAAAGLLAGLLAAAIIAVTEEATEVRPRNDPLGAGIFPAFGLTGAAIGGTLEWIDPDERWRRVPVPRPRPPERRR